MGGKRRVTFCSEEGGRIFSEKQREVWRCTVFSPHRYNISVGAVRSGKTYIDLLRIPRRIGRLSAGDNAVIIGNTALSAERNIILPMRDRWGSSLVGNVKSGGQVRLFGHDCFVMGADRACDSKRLQGMSIAYCYGDEITTWNSEVFRMLQSRLDKPYSVFDGTCNPDSPGHWFKKFLDSDADIYRMDFTIDDNPALSPGFVENLKREYAGTIYYDRFILGKWCCGEGAVYRRFAEDSGRFIIDNIDPGEIIMADVGVDFGGNGSAHAFILTGYTAGYRKIITLDEFYSKAELSPAELEGEFIRFIRRCRERYPCLRDVYCDSAEQVLIRGFKAAAARERLGVDIHNARKGSISDRIRFYCGLMGSGRYFVMRHCDKIIGAFSDAVYDSGGKRLDNGTTNIDSLDAQEYSTEKRMNDIIEFGGVYI